MKKLLLLSALLFIVRSSYAQATDLVGVTFGFSAGYSYSFNQIYDYSLTPDANHALKLQPLSQNSFVISSAVMVKLGKVAYDQTSHTFIKQAGVTKYNKSFLEKNSPPALTKSDSVSFLDHLSLNLSLDLINVSQDVSFNKRISGGIGIGYFLTHDLQIAAFYDITQVRQMRDYIVKSYENNPIPNSATTNYNALDTKDNTLFYDKTISGFSIKLILSLANKKPTS
ncbi:hypothetical protein ACFGVR_02590 [Mucilaginibacter sp. AW1-3]